MIPFQKNKPMRKILFILLSTMTLSLSGQNFSYRAMVDSVGESGYHRILLSPEITSKLNAQFFDIRLYDSKKTEIPYVLHKEQRRNEQDLFVEYPVLEKRHFRNPDYSRLVIHNPDKNKINNIVLRIKNADVRKRLKLNASNDRKNWYVLKDNYYYNSIVNNESTSEIRVLDFPLSDYEYYELLIEDYFDNPINILQAGYYNRVVENGKYTKLDNIKYLTKEIHKETIIAIPTNGNYIDEISFDIDSPKYYLRESEVYVPYAGTGRNKAVSSQKTISTFNLISNSRNTILLDNLKEDTLYIRIKNNDDAPLKIRNIHFYQLNKYLTAELNSGQRYDLLYSDTNATKPNYDLKYFADSITNSLKILGTHSPEKISKTDTAKNESGFSLEKYWLWIVIVGIAALLLYMSMNMVKENKRKRED
jgi:hypothetical protein